MEATNPRGLFRALYTWLYSRLRWEASSDAVINAWRLLIHK